MTRNKIAYFIRSAISGKIAQKVLSLVSNAPRFVLTSFVKIHTFLKENLRQCFFSYHSLRRFLLRNGYRRVRPRTMPHPQDPLRRLRFIQTLHALLKDPNVELWFTDEMGVNADGRNYFAIALKGNRPIRPISGKHIKTNVIGSVQPLSGEFLALVFSHVDSVTFQIFLDHLAEATSQRKEVKTIFVVLDNASWHRAKCLNWHHLIPLFLPTYSPDLNPIEPLWDYFKEQYLDGWFTDNSEELEVRVCDGLIDIMENPEIVSSICTIPTHP